MSSLASITSSITSSSEEDINQSHQDNSKGEGNQTEDPKSCDDVSETSNKKVTDEEKDESAELIIEYTVEAKQIDHDPIDTPICSPSIEESSPISQSANTEQSTSKCGESLTEVDKINLPIAVEGSLSPQPEPNSQVIEEVPRSVKEQAAIFANLNIQDTSSTSKPDSYRNPNNAQNKPSLPLETAVLVPASPAASASNMAVFKNASPQPLGTAETGIIKQVLRPSTDLPLNQSDRTTFDRPQPQDRPSQPPPQPKQFVCKVNSSKPLMTFGVPFGNGSQASQLPIKEVSPEQFLGHGVVAQTSGPPMMIRLRRPGTEAPWGFAVFGGADYGCPSFINRVTLHSIAAKAGLEVGDILVSVCDSSVQDMAHSQIKAEILRAGNELDITVIKQGIDKEILTQRAPHILRTPVPSPTPKVTYSGRVIPTSRATGSLPGPTLPSYVDRVMRTRSYGLLDDQLSHLNVSSHPSKQAQSKLVDVFSPVRSYYSGSTPSSGYKAAEAYYSTDMTQPPCTPTYSPSLSHMLYTPPQATSMPQTNVNRTYFASQGTGEWCNGSPTHGFYEPATTSPRLGTCSSSTNQQSQYFEGRNVAEDSSADDPGLMTQYYGTQQTCYARYYPKSQYQQSQMIQQEYTYQNNNESYAASPQHRVPASRALYRSPETMYVTKQEPKRQFRQYQPRQECVISPLNNQDQERWTTTGSIQTYRTGWV